MRWISAGFSMLGDSVPSVRSIDTRINLNDQPWSQNVVMGGAGSAVAESLAAQDLNVPLLQLGLPDQFVEHGDPTVLLADCGLNREGISLSIHRWLARISANAIAPKQAVS